MNIYKKALASVQNGGHFKIDFVSRSMFLNGETVIENGEPVGKYTLEPFDTNVTLSKTLEKIEQAYLRYRYSVPGQYDSRKAYFWAPSYYKMSEEDVLCGESRRVAQFRLEFRVLMALIKGTLYWDEVIMKHNGWFWRSNNQPELVILRSWIEQ